MAPSGLIKYKTLHCSVEVPILSMQCTVRTGAQLAAKKQFLIDKSKILFFLIQILAADTQLKLTLSIGRKWLEAIFDHTVITVNQMTTKGIQAV